VSAKKKKKKRQDEKGRLPKSALKGKNGGVSPRKKRNARIAPKVPVLQAEEKTDELGGRRVGGGGGLTPRLSAEIIRGGRGTGGLK